MLIVDVSEVKLPGEANQYNLPPECGQPIDGDDNGQKRGILQQPNHCCSLWIESWLLILHPDTRLAENEERCGLALYVDDADTVDNLGLRLSFANG
jgi:hypothetical protein